MSWTLNVNLGDAGKTPEPGVRFSVAPQTGFPIVVGSKVITDPVRGNTDDSGTMQLEVDSLPGMVWLVRQDNKPAVKIPDPGDGAAVNYADWLYPAGQINLDAQQAVMSKVNSLGIVQINNTDDPSQAEVVFADGHTSSLNLPTSSGVNDLDAPYGPSLIVNPGSTDTQVSLAKVVEYLLEWNPAVQQAVKALVGSTGTGPGTGPTPTPTVTVNPAPIDGLWNVAGGTETAISGLWTLPAGSASETSTPGLWSINA